MANSFDVKKALRIMPDDAPPLTRAGELGVDASDDNRLKYHNGTLVQDVLLTEDAFLPGFTDAANVNYDNATSGLAASDVQAAIDELESEKAPLDSPVLTGNPTAPTPSPLDSSDSIATTQYVDDAVAAIPAPPVTSVNGETGDVVLEMGDLDDVNTSGITAGQVLVYDGADFVPGDIAGAAADISFTPAGSIAATDVQAAIEEVDAEKQAADEDLTAVAALTGSGLAVRVTDNSWGLRSLQGTTDEITVGNSDAVAGDPAIGLADNPVLPGTGSVTVPVGTTVQRPGAPAEGMLRYNNELDTFEGYSAGAWGPIAGGGGGINYIEASDGNSTNGWATYADAAGTAPVDGTGGTPNVTWTTTTSSPLRGSSSFLFTKDAANRQGQGVSYLFTIANGDKARPCSVRFAYEVASGTYANGDLAIYVIDTTSGQVIQPSAFSILNAVGPAQNQPAEFQLNTGTTYRLCIHVASTSASAYTVKFDDFSLSPNTYSTGASATDFVSEAGYTASLGFGTISSSNFKSRKVGDSKQIRASFTMGTVAASAGYIQLPFSMDTSKLTANPVLGLGFAITTSGTPSNTIIGGGNTVTAFYDGSDATKIFFSYQSQSSTFVKNNVSNFGGNGFLFQFDVLVPVAGWGTSQVLSSETSTRVVASGFGTISSTTYTANANLRFTTKNFDTHGAYDSATGEFTAPVPGLYTAIMNGVYSSGSNIAFSLYEDGVVIGSEVFTPANNVRTSSSFQFQAKGGSKYTIRRTSGATFGDTVGSISFTRISGPAQIAASEKVRAKYAVAGSHNISTTLPLQYNTKVYDSHGAVTTGSSWRFTAPRNDVYTIKGVAQSAVAATISIYKNGSLVTPGGALVTASTAVSSFSTDIELNAGEYFELRSDTTTTMANTVLSLSIASQG